jgi:hypothetical protein
MQEPTGHRSSPAAPTTLQQSDSVAPPEASWRELWLVVTPVWFTLIATRVIFYAFERLRFPEIVPPVATDAIQGIFLWPAVALACYATLRIWVRAGLPHAVAFTLAATVIIGVIARPAYGLASLLLGDDIVRWWLDSLRSSAPGFWYGWMAHAVEYAALYLSCVAGTAAFLSLRSLMNERLLRARVEARAALERARALRAQLNPHFLFNSLNGIASLSEVQSPAAQELVTQLSDLLRRTLRASEYEQHQLHEELAYMEAYLRIQQIRQPLRINWHVHVDQQCRRAPVPTLILLPLVENAVTHGMRGGECNVELDIRVKRNGDDMIMQVGNTCCSDAAPGSTGGAGLGLRNVRERLQIIFGGHAALTAGRTRSDYFEAQVRIPATSRPAPTVAVQEALCEH